MYGGMSRPKKIAGSLVQLCGVTICISAGQDATGSLLILTAAYNSAPLWTNFPLIYRPDLLGMGFTMSLDVLQKSVLKLVRNAEAVV
jgi:hypothetical protein